MARSWLERRRIHRQAKQKLGLRQSPQEKFDFIEQCVESMTGDGITDDDDQARQICELLWEEQSLWDDYSEEF